MSVYLQDVYSVLKAVIPAEYWLDTKATRSPSITAGQVRTKNQTVFPDPLPEESAHANVCGPKPRSTRSWFAEQAKWVVPPPIS